MGVVVVAVAVVAVVVVVGVAVVVVVVAAVVVVVVVVVLVVVVAVVEVVVCPDPRASGKYVIRCAPNVSCFRCEGKDADILVANTSYPGAALPTECLSRFAFVEPPWQRTQP